MRFTVAEGLLNITVSDAGDGKDHLLYIIGKLWEINEVADRVDVNNYHYRQVYLGSIPD